MKKLILTIGFLLVAVNAHALILDVNWTGNSVTYVNDFMMLGSNVYQHLGLGGSINNHAIGFKAFEFTVNEKSLTDYLSVSATVVPTGLWFGPDRPEYYLPQDIDVSFLLYGGTSYYGQDGEYPKPDALLFSTEKYKFSTIDSITSQSYLDFQIPFAWELNTDTNYWLMADARNEWGQGSAGATFYYDTDLLMHTPEPATMFLFGTGLLGAFIRRRRRT